MNFNHETKTFSFIEETSKCKLHSEITSYYCTCKQKLCHKCIMEGVHLYQHSNVNVFPTKELRRVYINEIEDLELIFNEMSEYVECNTGGVTLKDYNELSDLKNFSQKFTFLIKSLSLNFFNEMFRDQSKVFKEVKSHMNEICKDFKVLKSEETIDIVTKTRVLKEKMKLSLVSKFEKISKIQNILINKNDEIEFEFNNLLHKFFGDKANKFNLSEEDKSYYEENNKEENSFFKLINSNINKIINADEVENLHYTENPEGVVNPYFLNSSMENLDLSELNKIIKSTLHSNSQNKSNNNNKNVFRETSTPKKFLSSSKCSKAEYRKEILTTNSCNKKLTSAARSISIWNDEIMELSKSQISESLFYDKESENELNNENEQDDDEEIVLERSTENLRISIHEDNSCDLSYDKKSMFNDICSVGNENRNRIHKIIRKKTKFENKSIFEMITAKKKSSQGYGQYGSKNYNTGTDTSKTKMNNFNNFVNNNSDYLTPSHNHNHVTPTSYNQKNNLKNYNTQCTECMVPYTGNKNNPNWKKKCSECQKNYNGKANKYKGLSVNSNNCNTNSVTENTSVTSNHYSYKAGKINQICYSCNNSFIVPMALAKQRKTCYYCFKAGKGPKE